MGRTKCPQKSPLPTNGRGDRPFRGNKKVLFHPRNETSRDRGSTDKRMRNIQSSTTAIDTSIKRRTWYPRHVGTLLPKNPPHRRIGTSVNPGQHWHRPHTLKKKDGRGEQTHTHTTQSRCWARVWVRFGVQKFLRSRASSQREKGSYVMTHHYNRFSVYIRFDRFTPG